MVIVVVDGSERGGVKPASVSHMLKVIEASGLNTLAVASNTTVPHQDSIGLITYSEKFPLGAAISEYLKSNAPATGGPSTTVVLVSAEASELNEISSALQQLSKLGSGIGIVPTYQVDDEIELPGMTEAGFMPGDLISHLQPNIMIPCVAMSTSRSLFESGRFSCITMAGLAIELMLEAYSRGESIEMIDGEVTVPSDLGVLQAHNRELGRALRHSIEVIPVEELFPSNPWDTRRPESTLSCYQQLAAKFVRFGDLQAAESCLNQADRISESARSLALRAVIAMERGETLGAIAKLITSLQEYEQQKQPSASLAIESGSNSPAFDSVNTELKAGLDALNAQDNSSALRHFARAVREFDSFYRDSGLLLLV